ncbi:MAG TPA: acyl carrier protein [Kofleriaceae bacterium]
MIDLVIGAIRHLAERRLIPADLASRPLEGATALDELGIDSLGKLELLSEIEERADVVLSEGLIHGMRTLDDLSRAVAHAKER